MSQDRAPGTVEAVALHDTLLGYERVSRALSGTNETREQFAWNSANDGEQSQLDGAAAAVLGEQDGAGTSGERRCSARRAIATGQMHPFGLCSGS